MATIPLQAESPCANSLSAVRDLACSTQSLLLRVSHLIHAMLEASDHVNGVGSANSLNPLDRIIVFAELADEAAKAAMEKAHEIERMTFHLKDPR